LLCFSPLFYARNFLSLFFGIRNYAEGTTFGYYFYDNIYYSSITIFVSTVFCLFKLMSKSEAEKRQLIEEKKNSELQALKTQINPHFIFNSLNNIYSLVYQNSDKSLPAIEELSQLLRYSTKDLEKDFIPLSKEIGYLESLIELEKLRIKKSRTINY
jgi:LytS/YehU family sensor histidine kinase